MIPLAPWPAVLYMLVALQWRREIADPDHPYHWVTQMEEPKLELSAWGLESD